MRSTCGWGYDQPPYANSMPCDHLLTKSKANVMLAYPVGEACDLLDTKLSGARQKMSDCQEDLDFLREQITVSRGSNLEFITIC